MEMVHYKTNYKFWKIKIQKVGINLNSEFQFN